MSASLAMAESMGRLRPMFAQKKRVYRALSTAAEPTPELNVAEWAEQRRYVSAEAGSSRPGKWSNATVPFAVEIMLCLAPEHPARIVTMMIASQIVKTEIGLNWIGQTMDVDPAPFLVMQPSLDEARLFSSTKFEPMVEATPSLKGKVFDVVERSRSGSTTRTKKFRGGVLHIVSAGASKDLQGKSVKRVFADEIAEYKMDAGDRGDPLAQGITRTDGHADYKVLQASTPKELPTCRITDEYEKGDRRRYYVACPHCAVRQTLELEGLVSQGEAAFYTCGACGVLIGEEHKTAMLAEGVWLKTYPSDDAENPFPPSLIEPQDLERWRARGTEGREPSFHLSQLYSPFKSWSRLLGEAREADRAPATRKTFRQQKLGLAWDPAVDAPDYEELFKARGHHVRRGFVPEWACLLTGAADVQNDRIEWAVYAWGPEQTGARIDWGVIWGDTATSAPFVELASVVQQRWPGEATVDLGLDAFGIDSGGAEGRTAKVYEFVRRAIGLKALKGASKHDGLPLEEGSIGKARTKSGKFVKGKVWLVNGYALKKQIYAMLYRGVTAQEEGARLPVALYYTADSSEEHFKQLTAEVFKEPRSRRAGARGYWEHISGRANEQLDLAVYCYALAWDKGLESWGDTEWSRLFAARAKPSEEAPLLDYAAREAAQASLPIATAIAPAAASVVKAADATVSPPSRHATDKREKAAAVEPSPAAAAPNAPREQAQRAADAPPPAPPAQRVKLAENPKPGQRGKLPAWMEKLAEHNAKKD